MSRKAVLFDRDGVLNEAIIRNQKPYPPASLEEMRIPSDALSCLQSLKQAGFLLIAATNQPDVARGSYQKATVEAINKALQIALPLDHIYVCYHDDKDECHCRKPKPGLLQMAARDYQLDLTQCYLIGDRWKDIAAGFAAACQTIWLDAKYAEAAPDPCANFTTNSLTLATEWILQQEKKNVISQTA